jgi:cytochrome c peroxidase
MRMLLPYVERTPQEIQAEWLAIVMAMGWDGRGSRFKMDQAYGPHENPIEYRLRERRG